MLKLKLLTPIILTISLLSNLKTVTAYGEESINCMINKDEGNCLSYLTAYDECYEVVANCMRKHTFDVVKSVRCCEEQDCGRDKNKPSSLVDQMKESSCIFKCMLKNLPSIADIYQEFMVIFAPTGTEHKETELTKEAKNNINREQVSDEYSMIDEDSFELKDEL